MVRLQLPRHNTTQVKENTMDISSKKYSLKSIPGNIGYILSEKKEHGRMIYILKVPSTHYLAMISESRFDIEANNAMETGHWG